LKLKKCVSCGFVNPASSSKCEVCGGDLSGTSVMPERKESKTGFFLAPVLIACAFGAYLLFPVIFGDVEKNGIETLVEENSVLNAGTLRYSLEKLGNLRFPDEEEEKVVFSGLESPAPEIRLASAGTLFLWASVRAPGRFEYLKKACSILKDKNPVVKASAARLLAETLKRGLFSEREVSPDLPGLGFFLEDPDKTVRIAGTYLLLFLEKRENAPEAAYRNFMNSPDEREKIFSACLLSKYGEKSFEAHLKTASLSKDPETRETAVFCLERFYSRGKPGETERR